MTGRDRFATALERKPLTGLVPHFELVFYLTREVLGLPHPEFLNLGKFDQMAKNEQQLYLHDVAEAFVGIAEKYDHDAIFVQSPGGFDDEKMIKLLETIRERDNGRHFLVMHGDATYSIPDGNHMMDFTVRVYEDEDGLKKEAAENVDNALRRGEYFMKSGLLDGFALCSDYCFNTNPFLSPEMFGEFITPYLARLTKGYRDMGFYVIKHTDGNIMPILDQLAQTNPHALHSIDPQAGVSLAEVKRLVGDRLCLIGNVNCGLLQNGTDEEVAADVRRCLHEGMPGYGYIFSTSNCVYTGMDIKRYELMHSIWKSEGIYR